MIGHLSWSMIVKSETAAAERGPASYLAALFDEYRAAQANNDPYVRDFVEEVARGLTAPHYPFPFSFGVHIHSESDFDRDTETMIEDVPVAVEAVSVILRSVIDCQCYARHGGVAIELSFARSSATASIQAAFMVEFRQVLDDFGIHCATAVCLH
jgi:hypothetical protein